MTPFGLRLQPGQSIFDQLVAAAQKAIVNGELTEGQDFPSVRTLAVELKIHPNTAHKAVQHLIQEGWLEKRPGLGTVVAPAPNKLGQLRQELVQQKIAALVSEARQLGMKPTELQREIAKEWERATPEEPATAEKQGSRR